MRKNRVSPLADPKTKDQTRVEGISSAAQTTSDSSPCRPKTGPLATPEVEKQQSAVPTELQPVCSDSTAGSPDKIEAQKLSAGLTVSEPTSQEPLTSTRRWSTQFQKEMMDYETDEEEWPRFYPRSYRRLSLRKFQRSYSVDDEPRPLEGSTTAKQPDSGGQTWKVDLKMVSDWRPSLADQPTVMDEEWPRISSRFYSTVSPDVQREYLACLLSEEVKKATTVIAGTSQWKALDLEDVRLALDLLGRAHQAKRESVASHPTPPQPETGAASPPTLRTSAPAPSQAEAETLASIALTRAVPVVLPHDLAFFRLSDPMMRVYQSDKKNVFKLEPIFIADYEGNIPEARKCPEKLEKNNNMSTGTDISGNDSQDESETLKINKLIAVFNLKATDLEALPCLLVHRHGQRVIIQEWKVLVNVDKQLTFYREVYLRSLSKKEGRQNSVTEDLESEKNEVELQETKKTSDEGTASNNSETKTSSLVLQAMLSDEIIEDLKRLYTVFVTWFPENLEGGWLASLFLEAGLGMAGDVKFSDLVRHVMDTLQELRITDVLILTPLLTAALQKNVEQFYDVYSKNPDVLECCCGFPYLRTSVLAAIGLGWSSFLEDLKNLKHLETGDLVSWRNFKSLSRITFLMLFDAGQTEQLTPYLTDASRDDLRVDDPEEASKATQAELQVAEGLCSAWLCCVRKASLMESGLWTSCLPVLEAWLDRVSRQQPWLDYVHGLRHVRGRDIFKMAKYLRAGKVACPKLRVFMLVFYGPEREELRCALTELSSLMSAEEAGNGSESFNRFTTFLLALALNFQPRDNFVELLNFVRPKLLSLHKSDLYYIPALGSPVGRSTLRKIIGDAPPGTFLSWEMLLLLCRGDLTALHAMLSGQAGRPDVDLSPEFLLDVLQHGQLEEFMDLAQAIFDLPCGPQLLSAPQGYDFLLRAATRAPPRLFFQLYEGKVKGKLEQDKCDKLLDMMMRNGPPVDLIY